VGAPSETIVLEAQLNKCGDTYTLPFANASKFNVNEAMSTPPGLSDSEEIPGLLFPDTVPPDALADAVTEGGCVDALLLLEAKVKGVVLADAVAVGVTLTWKGTEGPLPTHS